MDHISTALDLAPLSSEHIYELKESLKAKFLGQTSSQHGRLNPWYGQKHTAETKKLLSELAKKRKTRSGFKHSEETKEKMRQRKLGKPSNRKGHAPWNKGIAHSDDAKRKISQAKTGVKRSEKARIAISEACKKRKKQMCEHCEQEFDRLNYSKWHGAKCKYA